MATRDSLSNPSIEAATEVANSVGADLKSGLTSEEAARRLAKNGANALRAATLVPTWRRVVSHFRDPLVYLLMAAIAVALSAWAIEGGHGWPVDAIVIAAVIIANGLLGFVQEAKAESAVAALSTLTKETCAVMRDGRMFRVPSTDLVQGDLLVLGEGDSVGADGRLFQASALRIQEASLTGESAAVLKDAAQLTAPSALGDQFNMVFKGTAVVQGTGMALVTATGMGTQIGQIAHMLEATNK